MLNNKIICYSWRKPVHISLRDNFEPYLMTLVRLDGKFERWTVDTDEGVIFDDANNHYYLEEIRTIFFTRQWFGSAKEKLDQKKILFLRDELDRKIKMVEKIKLPKITVEWEEAEIQILDHPYKRK